MNSYMFSLMCAVALAGGALAQYQQQGHQQSYGRQSYGNQRKTAPSPQMYGSSAGGYQHQQQQQHYQPAASSYGHQQEASSGYGQEMQSYRAPSSASTSTYDQRTPVANSYGKQQSSYGAQSGGSSYGKQQQQQASYSAPAAYEQEQYHAPMPFAWGYDINDGYGGAQFHKETGDEYGKRTGSYGYTDAYGIYRQVDYVADEHGFRATIKTNEPGTSSEAPADVELHAYEPPSNYYAGTSGNYGKQSAGYGQQQQQSAGYGQQQQQQQGYGSSSSYGGKQSSGYGAAGSYQRAAPVVKSY